MTTRLTRVMLQRPVTDSSGLRFFVTPTLRQHDAGLLNIGITTNPQWVIPARTQVLAFGLFLHHFTMCWHMKTEKRVDWMVPFMVHGIHFPSYGILSHFAELVMLIFSSAL